MPSHKNGVHKSRILVAEDQPRVRKLFARKLRSAGYLVSETNSGEEALSLLRDLHARLLVLDLDIPDTDGFQVLRTVRSNYPHLQVLVVSGYKKGALLEAAECFGARATLKLTSAPHHLVGEARKLLGDAN
jgi:CheY-like chemotaxis protein